MTEISYVRIVSCPECGGLVKLYTTEWLADRKTEINALAKAACKNCNKINEMKKGENNE